MLYNHHSINEIYCAVISQIKSGINSSPALFCNFMFLGLRSSSFRVSPTACFHAYLYLVSLMKQMYVLFIPYPPKGTQILI